MGSLITVLLLGLVLGIKHSIEPDHIIAVSTMVSNQKKLWRSTLTGIFWGIGHTSTLFIVGMVLVLLKGELPEVWAMSLEFLVGIMLVYLGFKNFVSVKSAYRHSHQHAKSSLLKVTVIGFIHGLAGSAAMVILTLSTVESVWECAIYILVFGVGTITGMLIFTTILGIPFVYSQGSIKLNRGLMQTAGTVSFLFGLYYMYNLGITEGLFELWVK
ncbi:HupE/UreJ family protein [Paenibacillus glycanilyticus]|uniref:Hydantoin utilization protein A n=1 Tax=Paenibacillus glycanilyticus TaxID=126569 RepID=A0ABQ6G6C8_9BACL|nr:urease accessory protein UreH [Paenibacillus glycanilyticus]GLX66523.1 hydantoin utilization protein A [Paenibacillus glycanilyticus]